MRIPIEEHRKHDWLVARLAPDFELLDAWRYPVEIEHRIPLDRFIDFLAVSQRELIEGRTLVGGLFRLRGFLGRCFGWDSEDGATRDRRPIPGCRESSLRERLAEIDLDQERTARSAPASEASDDVTSAFEPVYRRENESLAEISNQTVHAMMHLGRVEISSTHWSPQMGVYVKTRGQFGNLYMMAISPFRHRIVYPAMMRTAKKNWPRFAATG